MIKNMNKERWSLFILGNLFGVILILTGYSDFILNGVGTIIGMFLLLFLVHFEK